MVCRVLFFFEFAAGPLFMISVTKFQIRTEPEKGTFFDSGVRSECVQETTKSESESTRGSKCLGPLVPQFIAYICDD